MKRKKGRLLGRFVNAYLRKAPHRPSEYVGVTAYQEQVAQAPSVRQAPPAQGELELSKARSEDKE
jgi:hypothetical protein